MRWHVPWLLTLSMISQVAWADDRVSAAGYFRVQARPDWEGGNGRLGFWNLYGRLMNEGPYAALEVKFDLLQAPPESGQLWAAAHARVEGGSISGADSGNGSLTNFRVSQLYVRAGNLLFDKVTWQLGTLVYFFGDLGLYDLRPATVFDDTIGISARYQLRNFDLLIGIGDSGFFNRGAAYNPLLTAGAVARVRLGEHVEIGGGGQIAYEPRIDGNRNAPYQTPTIQYADYVRREVARRYVEANPGQESLFPKPEAVNGSMPFRVVGYLGFGKWGPIRWNSTFVSYRRLPSEQSYTETFQNRDYSIYIANFTNQRFQFQLGNEMQLRLIPNRLDAVWGVLVGDDSDFANSISADERNRTYWSTVLRLQLYVNRTVHVLLEGSYANEKSKNGNLYREHYDSIFRSTNGVSDTRGLEFGDAAVRNTVQIKTGIVLNPTGFGIYARPSIRLLYGLQYSTQQAAFGNGFSDSLDQFNQFPGTERHFHHLISLEAEGWF